MKGLSIEHLCKLANIKIEGDEMEKLREDLSDIMEHIDRIKEVDISDVSSSTEQTVERTPLREDKVTETLSGEQVLKNAVDREGNFLKVEKITRE